MMRRFLLVLILLGTAGCADGVRDLGAICPLTRLAEVPLETHGDMLFVRAAILGSPVSDFPRFDDPTTHLSLNLALLTLMAIYASASVALGFKASNLTHRGIVARGPYAVIRHPAYVCKNLAWWIGSVPLVTEAFHQSMFGGMQAVASVAGWSMIYILRALTEEDHLRSVDGEYAAYATKVRYRFIPGVI